MQTSQNSAKNLKWEFCTYAGAGEVTKLGHGSILFSLLFLIAFCPAVLPSTRLLVHIREDDERYGE